MKILLILDIDETFLHLVTGRHTIPSDYNYDKVPFDETSTVYFRPGFAEFIEFAKVNRDWLTLGIWTYGNKLYADMNHRYLLKKFNLPEDMFLLVYSETEIKQDLNNGLFEKDLRRVYKTHPEFTHENTFLVDNRPANIYHMANKENGIIVESFVPTSESYNPYEDTVFKTLIELCKTLKQTTIKGGSVFNEDNINKTYLTHLRNQFMVGDDKISFITIGKVDEDDNFRIFRGGFQRKKYKNTKKRNGRWNYTRMRNKIRNLVGFRSRNKHTIRFM